MHAARPEGSLTADFMMSAQRRLSRIGVLLDDLRQHSDTEAAVVELRSMFHNLAGLAGAFGFALASRRARAGELLCSRIRSESRAATRQEHQVLSDTANAITHCLAIEQGQNVAHAPSLSEVNQVYTIYVLEWSDVARDIWLSELEADGMLATGVSSVEELAAAMANDSPDAIIADADLMMRDDFQLLWQLQALRPRRPITLLVGTIPDFRDKLRAIRMGADAYFDTTTPHDRVLHRLQVELRRASRCLPRILIIDDDPIQTAWLRAILEPAGYMIQSCNDAAQFEHELSTTQPDLLILDMMLSGNIKGSDLASYARQHEVYRTIPIIWLSGCERAELRAATQSSGGLYLQKPVEPKTLRDVIAGCLRMTGQTPNQEQASYASGMR